MRKSIVVSNALLVAALLLPAASFAQDGPPGGRGGRGQGRMMQQSTVAWLLDDVQKEQYRPSGEQIAKLQTISEKLQKDFDEQRAKMQKMRDEAMNGGGDRGKMREEMREAMDKLRKKDEEAVEDALKVLNDEQKKVVKDLLDARKKEMDSRPRPRFGQ
ncbi:MAG TPA: Spy/CpxP family protein refolding chaperone [Longimicrobiales bacterium]|nr:Spy/CpxP family protein refolding chaperone [Longimicrobiales bacterium]